MPYRSLTTIILLLLPFYCFAQFTITGKIINSKDKQPVAGASVFFDRADFGDATSSDGAFHLTGVKNGQYQMIVSAVGYVTYTQTLLVDKDIHLADIMLVPKIIGLKEVKIRLNFDREKYYQMFKRQFLGLSDNADQCKILNPDILSIDYESKKLTVSSDEFLQIENKALGYKIKYLLDSFVLDEKEDVVSYKGHVLFEKMSGSISQQKRWEKNRLKAYTGSQMHFLRSAIGNQLNEEGFTVLRRNPLKRPAVDSILQAKMSKRRPLTKNKKPSDSLRPDSVSSDSLVYWHEMKQQSGVTEKQIDTPLNVYDILKRTDKKIVYALTYPESLYVIYVKKAIYKGSIYHAPILSHHPGTTVTFLSDYLFFDVNGGVTNPEAVLLDGFWGNERVADLLPLDYDPGKSQNATEAPEADP